MKNAEVIADSQLSRVLQTNPVCEAPWRQAYVAQERNLDPLSPLWFELLTLAICNVQMHLPNMLFSLK